MKIIIILEFILNLLLLLLYHMHMFQLNSYAFGKHIHWMKKNLTKLISQTILVLLPTILLLFCSNIIALIIVTILLAISCIYNIPKKSTKIALKFTKRVKRMFFTELLLILLTFFTYNVENFIYIKLFFLNVLSPFLVILANFINSPIEKLGKKHYIKQAKKILNDMPNLLVIGVTGSYGKTSVKNFLTKVLSTKYEVLTTPKNYNTPMGIVKTIREELKPTHQIFICEMGAARVGEIKEICDIVNPQIGIITSIGPQHLETFKSIDNIIETKFELAKSVHENNGVVFLNYDNEYIRNHVVDGKFITYGINNASLDYNSYNIVSSSKGLNFNILNKNSNEEVTFKTKLIGKHNVVNLTGIIAVAKYLDIPTNKIIRSVQEIKNVEHRLQLIPHGDLSIIDDSYNSNPISSKSALDTLSEFEGTKIIVTPGLIELGKDEEKYNFEFGKYITNVCDYIFLVNSTSAKFILDGVNFMKFNKNKIFHVNSPQEAISKISSLNISGKITVLLENDLPDNYNK